MSRSCSLFNHARSKAPHPSPLPEGEGADRSVLRHASTWKTEVIVALNSVKNAQVGVDLEHPPISPLALWECMYRRHGGQVFGDMVDTF
ncbi:hypothetical protein DMX04_23535 [Pseudomonas koreensis]|nr:hypothetical protein DMX04_23535 [Pseudomonas koreensis]